MIIIVFSVLFKIASGAAAADVYRYFIVLVLLVVFKGVCNVSADIKKNNAKVSKAMHTIRFLGRCV